MSDLQTLGSMLLWLLVAMGLVIVIAIGVMVFVSVIGFICISPCLKIISLRIRKRLSIQKALEITRNPQYCYISALFPAFITLLCATNFSSRLDNISLADVFEKYEIAFQIPFLFFLLSLPIELTSISKLESAIFQTLNSNQFKFHLKKDYSLVSYMRWFEYTSVQIKEEGPRDPAMERMQKEIFLKKFKNETKAIEYCYKHDITITSAQQHC